MDTIAAAEPEKALVKSPPAARVPSHHGRVPVIINRAVPAYRALMLELDRRRHQLSLKMWEVDDLAGLNDGHYAHLLHADRPSGRQGTWASLHLVFSALFPDGFDLEAKPKQGGALTAESHALKVKMAAADNNRLSRRELMRELGKRGAAARMLKSTKGERKKIVRKASNRSDQKIRSRCGAGKT
jgi:hypothetical protein